MGKAVCIVSVAALRAEDSHQSQMVSQMLYGESAAVMEVSGFFSRIRMDFDHCEGWVDSKQFSTVSDELASGPTQLTTAPFGSYDVPEGNMLLSIGSELNAGPIHVHQSVLETVAATAILFLNVPYLWSGRSFFGVDCSGFTQLVYKIHGVSLPREAQQQAEIGSVLDFVEESRPGDLAFFENEEGKIIHVGLMLEGQKIIHAYGKVRIDTLDSSGIFNHDLHRHTHKLRFIKNII